MVLYTSDSGLCIYVCMYGYGDGRTLTGLLELLPEEAADDGHRQADEHLYLRLYNGVVGWVTSGAAGQSVGESRIGL